MIVMYFWNFLQPVTKKLVDKLAKIIKIKVYEQ